MPKDYDYLLKVLLVGDSDVGTHEIMAGLEDASSESPFCSRSGNSYKITTILLDGKRVRLQLWDTSGQGRFCTIIRSYSRGAQGVILVYDITNKWSFDGLDRWLKEVEEHAPGVPKVLVGNRLHLAFKRQVAAKQAELYASRNKMACFEISPLCDFNIRESFCELARMALHRNGMERIWRSNKVLSLQELCCRKIVGRTSVYAIDTLPLPPSVKSHLKSYALTSSQCINTLQNTKKHGSPLVFSDKNEALKYLKKNRESRLKCFDSYEQAEQFAKCGLESPSADDVSLIDIETNGKSDISGTSKNCDKTTAKAPAVGEKPSSFRGPSNQELIKFRKLIENGEIETVYKTIWANPRYLVSSGDTPVILKESFRYNALHVASLAKNAKMCSMILETVGDPKFILLYHGRDDPRTAEDVSNILLDLYLNTPEKGRGETALHLAAKFGATEVVEVLTAYQECQMNPNVEGMLPQDIICTRNEAAGIDVVKAIRTLLQGRFYVPVMRSADNSLPPVIGEPFPETELPKSQHEDLLSPVMEIRAIAGPMNKEQAQTFRKRWKTPPRTLSSPASYIKSPTFDGRSINGSPLSSYPSSIVRQRNTPNKITSNDTPKISIEKTFRRLFELNGNDDCNDVNVATTNATKLGMPTNLNSAKKNMFCGYRDHYLDESLNDSLMNEFPASVDSSFNNSVFTSPGFRERNLKLADVDKGLEVIGRGLAKDHNIVWREHWAFLNEFIDIASHEGLTKFEKYLQQQLDSRMKPPAQKFMQPPAPTATPVSRMCNRFLKLNFDREQTPNQYQTPIRAQSSTPISPNAFHAYLCVEKSCQIYAKRLLKPIAQSPSNIVTINDVLVGELNRLKSLVCSYKNDLRFFAIDFSATHSRFAHMVVAFLKASEDQKTIDVFRHTLTQILEAKKKALQNVMKSDNKENAKNAIQLICLLVQLLRRLVDTSDLIFPEILTTENECSDIWQSEYKCDCEWSNANENTKPNRSIKRKMGSNHRLSDTFSEFCERINGLNIRNDEDSLNETDEEVYLSLANSDEDSIDSDEDEFFTPPESPILEMLDVSDIKDHYDNFIYGMEPTKMDNDVLKALHNVDVDKGCFPNISAWYNAVLKYSLEERANFPQRQQNSRTLAVIVTSPSGASSTTRFSRTPMKDILSKPNHFQLRPSKLFTKD